MRGILCGYTRVVTLMGYAVLLSWLFAPAVVVAAGFMG